MYKSVIVVSVAAAAALTAGAAEAVTIGGKGKYGLDITVPRPDRAQTVTGIIGNSSGFKMESNGVEVVFDDKQTPTLVKTDGAVLALHGRKYTATTPFGEVSGICLNEQRVDGPSLTLSFSECQEPRIAHDPVFGGQPYNGPVSRPSFAFFVGGGGGGLGGGSSSSVPVTDTPFVVANTEPPQNNEGNTPLEPMPVSDPAPNVTGPSAFDPENPDLTTPFADAGEPKIEPSTVPPSTVPAPAPILLFGTALAGMVLLGRRRRQPS